MVRTKKRRSWVVRAVLSALNDVICQDRLGTNQRKEKRLKNKEGD